MLRVPPELLETPKGGGSQGRGPRGDLEGRGPRGDLEGRSHQ